MFRIKICGITRSEDAGLAVEAGADAIGLNFYPQSRRYVSPGSAQAIRASISPAVQLVGVFVNATHQEIHEVAQQVGLQTVQLHGDEPAESLTEISNDLKIIRVYRPHDNAASAIAEDLAACQQAGRLPDAVLVDAAAPGQYGGTGEMAPWYALTGFRAWLGEIPLILAGGLTPQNVAEAILTVQPDGVDVASGVESEPGRKDATLVSAFVRVANPLITA